MKHVTLYICVCSPSRFSASLSWNIGIILGAKIYFTDHRTTDTIQLFVPIKREIFRSLLFQNKSQWRGILVGLLDKYSHLSSCISLKWTLSCEKTSLQCQNPSIKTNSLCWSALPWTSFSFLQVNQWKQAEWFLTIMCK